MGQRILIVDDEASIVTLLVYHIEKSGYRPSVASDGIEAIKKAEQERYDLIVLDIMLPKKNGMEVCKSLRDRGIDTPVLMLTAKAEEADKIYGLEIGADDYLTKPFSPHEVIARIKAILRRTNSISKESFSSLKIGGLVIYPEKYEVKINNKTITFTRKEFELLLYLANHKGKVLSRNELLSEVWNYDFVGDSRIVDVHVSRLRDKIEPDTRKPIYITTIRGSGYKMEDLSS